ncbi:polyprenyl synthetase family protein [Caldimonas thermodepolymerans]|jgi:Geranylgeranyl pyrophosphate synthase|uniref:Farnesyl diphosphate synthase n=1 Tax=Caldimonas thermodepolymerans TaxID=215580 RepID=A0A2S5T9V1_9BURK|nr:polyprenyl synthetase [Caldimonas thermodepolymerans]QPC30662.1 polyprenyl synthetase family protein [Caldimonas thermodepolymerans]RDI02730.1 farnesyl diphosphate synthase [Caldimonas thermodepolymerans]TCP08740.1 farnesyl diphosphate synthase [Caldimonas thermodepolymerans]
MSLTSTDRTPAACAAADFDGWMQAQLLRVEDALSRWVPADAPAGLGAAMRYSVLDGGKRLRPLLVLAAAEAVDGHAEAALRAACAVELIHAYSLVHDDMPCMDNDVMRRGKPTVHVKFGEAVAMLTGDAMQALAFEVLTPEGEVVPPALQATLCRLLSRASGCEGMAGGQAIDLASVGRMLDETELRDMHRRKTGALLRASVQMGAACGRTDGPAWDALSDYGWSLGLAFQVVDDILDVTQASETLGKTAGKDADNGKPTYVSVLGLDAARRYAGQLREQAHQALARSGLADVRRLAALADKVVDRQS